MNPGLLLKLADCPILSLTLTHPHIQSWHAQLAHARAFFLKMKRRCNPITHTQSAKKRRPYRRLCGENEANPSRKRNRKRSGGCVKLLSRVVVAAVELQHSEKHGLQRRHWEEALRDQRYLGDEAIGRFSISRTWREEHGERDGAERRRKDRRGQV